LSPPRLIAAYQRGIFPWYSQGQPILWWCPDPRAVLFPQEFVTSRSLAKTLRNRGFRITFDTCFAQVAAECAGSGDRAGEGTWISPQMHAAYVTLHKVGRFGEGFMNHPVRVEVDLVIVVVAAEGAHAEEWARSGEL